MEKFPTEVHTNLKWYVYRLIDPRNGNTFYVGKGQRDRVFEHARGEVQEKTVDQNEFGVMGPKKGVIDDIHRAGLSVLHVIHRHGFDNPEIAYQVEAALIDAYPGLTNLVGGHGSSIFGCRSVEQIVFAYKAEPLMVKEPLILIFVGKALDDGLDIYDAVRGIWKMSQNKAEKHRLVLAYDGVLVLGAYRPDCWLPGTRDNFDFLTKEQEDPKRIGFKGRRADVWDQYVGKRVPPRPKGAANPFRYLSPGDQPLIAIEADDGDGDGDQISN
jgi:hypothetical protein